MKRAAILFDDIILLSVIFVKFLMRYQYGAGRVFVCVFGSRAFCPKSFVNVKG